LHGEKPFSDDWGKNIFLKFSADIFKKYCCRKYKEYSFAGSCENEGGE
jgi:hypothetical protein